MKLLLNMPPTLSEANIAYRALCYAVIIRYIFLMPLILSYQSYLIVIKFCAMVFYASASCSVIYRVRHIVESSSPLKIVKSVVSFCSIQMSAINDARHRHIKSAKNQSMNIEFFLASFIAKHDIYISKPCFAWSKDSTTNIALRSVTSFHNAAEASYSSGGGCLVKTFVSRNIFPNFFHINSCKLPVVSCMATDTGKRLSGATLAMQGEF